VKDIRQVAKRWSGDGGGSWWDYRPWPSAVRRLTRAWGLLAIAALLVALAAPCGGGGEPQAEGSPTPPPTAEDAALAPCRALQALKAYRYSVDWRLESPEPEETPGAPRPTPTSSITREFTTPFLFESNIEASFVAPDRFEVLFTTDSNEVSMIIIGSQTWSETNGRWRPTAQPYDLPYTPSEVCEAILADLDFSLVEPQEDKLNDVKSLHYTFSQVHSEQAWAKIYGPGSDLDILLKKLDVDLWLAEKGNWPVRIDTRSSGLYGVGRELRVHLLIDIRDSNSGDIRVEPPL